MKKAHTSGGKTHKANSRMANALSGADTEYMEDPTDYPPVISHRTSKAKVVKAAGKKKRMSRGMAF